MKSTFRIILTFASLLGPTSAFADPNQWHLVCTDMAADGGYEVTFSPDGLSAEVAKNNIAGARIVANLACFKATTPCCDRVTTTVCVDEPGRTANDTGYAATLQVGGLAGISRVTLHHGRAEVAVIGCRPERYE